MFEPDTPLRDIIVPGGVDCVDPDDALRIWTECYWPDRPTFRGHASVHKYRWLMALGEWRGCSDLGFAWLPGGHLILVDGYRRLKALWLAGICARPSIGGRAARLGQRLPLSRSGTSSRT
jgi:hypothetical protein